MIMFWPKMRRSLSRIRLLITSTCYVFLHRDLRFSLKSLANNFGPCLLLLFLRMIDKTDCIIVPLKALAFIDGPIYLKIPEGQKCLWHRLEIEGNNLDSYRKSQCLYSAYHCHRNNFFLAPLSSTFAMYFST